MWPMSEARACLSAKTWAVHDSQRLYTSFGFKPMTPPPRPSHPGIGARHTGHLLSQRRIKHKSISAVRYGGAHTAERRKGSVGAYSP